VLQCSLKNGITTDTVGSAEENKISALETVYSKIGDIFVLAKKRTFRPEKELNGNFPKYRKSGKEKIPQKGRVTIFHGSNKKDPLYWIEASND
jgi:hypothetical protein